MKLEHERCYKAVLARDPRYDGRFFTGVLTTGIFCRPICPARPPLEKNCTFYPSSAAAGAAGFRPCLRCRPELSPDLPGWNGTSTTVIKALRYISEGYLNENSVEELASKMGVGERHLRRLFKKHMGISPKEVAMSRRLLLAKKLLSETSLPLTQIALAAGFQSLRRFNDIFLKKYRLSPGKIRKAKQAVLVKHASSTAINLQLNYMPPFSWEMVIGYLKTRAMSGVERVTDHHYARSFMHKGKTGHFKLYNLPEKNALQGHIDYPDIRELPLIISKIRTLFDLDCNISVINQHLSKHNDLKERIRKNPGIRVVGAWDPFELSIRAILGQQISVIAATTLVGRMIEKYGTYCPENPKGLQFIFPSVTSIAQADLSGLGIPQKRIEAIQNLATILESDPDFFGSALSLDHMIKKLTQLKGIGPWTAHYVAMRALREPDAFPAADLVLLKALSKNDKRPTPKELEKTAEQWRPWRAYGAMYLWNVELT